jgi:hypothetical protein
MNATLMVCWWFASCQRRATPRRRSKDGRIDKGTGILTTMHNESKTNESDGTAWHASYLDY